MASVAGAVEADAMSETSAIEWTDSTFNPWIGCTKVGPGCDHCYAEADFDLRRHRVQWGAGNPRSRTSLANWQKPLQWDRAHAEFLQIHGRRRRVFCASLADVFDNEVPPEWRMDLFSLIAKTPNLDWLILTKRIGNVMPMCSGDGLMFDMITNRVWLGATICNQEEANRDIPKLLKIPARVRFLSMEPLLEFVDLSSALLPCPNAADGLVMDPETGAYECCPRCDYSGISYQMGVDWVIVGGESGPKARPMHPNWARNIRNQCLETGTPFLFKQWGEFAPGCDVLMGDDAAIDDSLERDHQLITPNGYGWHINDGQPPFGTWAMHRVGKKRSGRLLDGMRYDRYPVT